MKEEKYLSLLDICKGLYFDIDADKRYCFIKGTFSLDYEKYSYRTIATLILKKTKYFQESCNIKRGDKILFPFETTIENIVSFFALIALDAVPLSVKPHMTGMSKSSYDEFCFELLKRYDPDYVVDLHYLKGLGLPTIDIALKNVSEVDEDYVSSLSAFDTAIPSFVQFSSGSTSFPKGVPITQEKLMRHCYTICKIDSRTRDTVVASWLPLYHDMGLIGLLSCLVYQNKGFLCSPVEFMLSPSNWFKKVSDEGVNEFPIPNFGLEYLKNRFSMDSKESLDLSNLKTVLLGSDSVDIELLEEFYEAFKQYGLSRDVFAVGYGMAENVLILTASIGKFPNYFVMENGTKVTSVGVPVEGVEVSIDDIDSYLDNEVKVGEILIKSCDYIEGYYLQEKLDFRNGFAKTGDLGFLYNGELYVLGRRGDRFKIRGENYYAVDFERSVEKSGVVKKGRSLAIFAEGNVVISCDISSAKYFLKKDKYKKEIVTLVLDSLGYKLDPKNLYFVRRSGIFKTSSGKLQRSKAMKEYTDNGIIESNPILFYWDIIYDIGAKVVGGIALYSRVIFGKG